MNDDMFNLEDLFSKEDLKKLSNFIGINVESRDDKTKITKKIKSKNNFYLTFLLKNDSMKDYAEKLISSIENTDMLEAEFFIILKSLTPLEIKNIKYFKFKEGFYGIIQEPYSAKIEEFYGEANEDIIQEKLQDFSNKIDKSINFYGNSSSGSNLPTPHNPNNLLISVSSSPVSRIARSTVNNIKLLGFDIDSIEFECPSIDLLIEENYYIFYTEENKIVFYFNNNFSAVYIPYNILQSDKEWNYQLFDKYLEEIKKVMDTVNSGDKEEFLKELDLQFEKYKEIQAEKARDFFINLANKNKEVLKENLNKELTQKQEKLKETEKSYATIIQRVNYLSMQIRGIESLDIEKQKERMSLDFRKLNENPLIKRVYLSEDQQFIKADTEMLYFYERTKNIAYLMGEFTLSVRILLEENRDNVSSDNYFKFDNHTLEVDAYQTKMQAPHVYNDTHACLGNIQQPLVELISSYDYRGCFEIMINFLQTVNVNDSAGCNVSHWPIVAGVGSKEVISYLKPKSHWKDLIFFEEYVKDKAKAIEEIDESTAYNYGPTPINHIEDEEENGIDF
jgi:hypothetical protein